MRANMYHQAGPAGLVTAHTLHRDGFENISVFTKDRTVGGTLALDRVYPTMRLNKYAILYFLRFSGLMLGDKRSWAVQLELFLAPHGTSSGWRKVWESSDRSAGLTVHGTVLREVLCSWEPGRNSDCEVLDGSREHTTGAELDRVDRVHPGPLFRDLDWER